MATAGSYRARVAQAMGNAEGAFRLEVSISTVKAAKDTLTDIRQMQKELRQIRSEVIQEQKVLRQGYAAQSDSAEPGCLSMFLGKGAMRSDRASKRRNIRSGRDVALQPYENIRLSINDMLTQMDGAKIQIQRYIEDNSE